jgi:hypothetical protein
VVVCAGAGCKVSPMLGFGVWCWRCWGFVCFWVYCAYPSRLKALGVLDLYQMGCVSLPLSSSTEVVFISNIRS